ncbi:MAG: hypothetical protein RIR43_874 [Pseudomonadota bacterium]|jgi:predicted nucleic acid-binding protein
MSARTLGPDPGRSPAAVPGVVLDTNAVLDLWVFKDPRVQGLAQALQAGLLGWLGCPGMRGELAHVLERGIARSRGLEPEAVLRAWDQSVIQPLCPDPPAISRLHCTDPDDQRFIELALCHQAKWLFTSDRALLKLARRAAPQGLVIRPPQGWEAELSP